MVGFVETKSIRADEPQKLTGDNTIGILRTGRGELLRGDVGFDLRRLRRAILAFEELVGDSSAELAIVKHSDAGFPMLALVEPGGSHEAIVLAPITDGKFPTDADELVQEKP